MTREEFASPAAMAPTGTHDPYWRARLESRWRACLREVTELSLAYHAAAGEPGGGGDRAAQLEAQTLLNRAVAARRELADVEDALGRLAAGNFGACEQCGAQIPAGLLADTPETRYCAHCDILPGGTEPARMLLVLIETADVIFAFPAGLVGSPDARSVSPGINPYCEHVVSSG